MASLVAAQQPVDMTAVVTGCAFVIDLPELGGADKIRALGKEVITLVSFEGH